MIKTKKHKYSLDFQDGYIIISSSSADLSEFIFNIGKSINQTTFAIEHNRTNVMIAESLGDVEYMTTAYIERRPEVFTIDESIRQQVLTLLPELHHELKSYQIDYISRSFNTPGYINGSEQGTGKTIASLVACVVNNQYDILNGDTRPKRILLLTSKDLIPQWFKEIEDWFVNFQNLFRRFNFGVQKVKDRINDFNDMIDLGYSTPLTIAGVNYETFLDQAKPIARFLPNYIIADESWKLMHADKSDTAYAYILLCDYARRENAKNGERTFVQNLTGTLISKHIGNVWSAIVTASGEKTMNYDVFLRRFAKQEKIDIGGRRVIRYIGCTDMPKVMMMMEPHYYRATKATCLDLPEKMAYEFENHPLSVVTSFIYDRVEEDGGFALNENDLSGKLITNLRLQQIAGGFIPCSVSSNTDDLMARIYAMIPEDKLDDSIEIVSTEFGDFVSLPCEKLNKLCESIELENDLENNQRIVWCHHRFEVRRIAMRLQNNLRYRGVQVAEIMGGQNLDIQNIKNQFNNRDHPLRVIVCTIDALCFGHNLQGGDINEYFSLTYKPIEFAQSVDRTHRLGRTEPVRYRIWMNNHTIDQKMWNDLQRDRDFAKQVEITTL